MGNVNMEAKQIHDRTEAGKHQSVADHLKALDAIAATIENLPTFTSNDRAFLEELPAFPTEDGTKVLTATTSSGETSLSYEEVESGENQIYSTTPAKVGSFEGSDVYRRVYDLSEALQISASGWTDSAIDDTGIGLIIKAWGLGADSTCPLIAGHNSEIHKLAFISTRSSGWGALKIIIEYIPATT